jgi:hypothetical protein
MPAMPEQPSMQVRGGRSIPQSKRNVSLKVERSRSRGLMGSHCMSICRVSRVMDAQRATKKALHDHCLTTPAIRSLHCMSIRRERAVPAGHAQRATKKTLPDHPCNTVLLAPSTPPRHAEKMKTSAVFLEDFGACSVRRQLVITR